MAAMAALPVLCTLVSHTMAFDGNSKQPAMCVMSANASFTGQQRMLLLTLVMLGMCLMVVVQAPV